MTRYAFFDVDDTLVRLKTMFSFQDFALRQGRWFGAFRAERFDARFRRLRAELPREEVNRRYYQAFRGRRPEDVTALAERWYAYVTGIPGGLYVPEALDALMAHRSAGVEVVLVSGSMVEILRPLASSLRVREVLATRVVVDGGRYTGEIVPPQTIGVGKAEAILTFLATRGGDASTCWAYADDISDVPMLATVGHPVVVSAHPDMSQVAALRGWQLMPVGGLP